MQVPREVLRGGSTSGAPPSALPLFLSEGWVGYPVSLRGGSTSGAPPSALPLFLSEGWVGVPSFPARGAAPPVLPLCAPPMGGPTRPTPGVPFVSRRKEPKACRGLPPLDPERGARCPPCGGAVKRRATPPNGGFRHNERPICPPTPSGQTGLLFSRSFFEGTLLAVNLRRGEFEVQDVKKS